MLLLPCLLNLIATSSTTPVESCTGAVCVSVRSTEGTPETGYLAQVRVTNQQDQAVPAFRFRVTLDCGEGKESLWLESPVLPAHANAPAERAGVCPGAPRPPGVVEVSGLPGAQHTAPPEPAPARACTDRVCALAFTEYGSALSGYTMRVRVTNLGNAAVPPFIFSVAFRCGNQQDPRSVDVDAGIGVRGTREFILEGVCPGAPAAPEDMRFVDLPESPPARDAKAPATPPASTEPLGNTLPRLPSPGDVSCCSSCLFSLVGCAVCR